MVIVYERWENIRSIICDVRNDYNWVMNMLMRKEPPGDYWRRIDWNLFRMRNKTGARIAHKIVNIEARLRTPWNDRTKELV